MALRTAAGQPLHHHAVTHVLYAVNPHYDDGHGQQGQETLRLRHLKVREPRPGNAHPIGTQDQLKIVQSEGGLPWHTPPKFQLMGVHKSPAAGEFQPQAGDYGQGDSGNDQARKGLGIGAGTTATRWAAIGITEAASSISAVPERTGVITRRIRGSQMDRPYWARAPAMQSTGQHRRPAGRQCRHGDHHQGDAAGGYQDVARPNSPDPAGLEGRNCPADNQSGKSGPDQVFPRLFRHQRRRGHRRHYGSEDQQRSPGSRQSSIRERDKPPRVRSVSGECPPMWPSSLRDSLWVSSDYRVPGSGL